MWRAKLLRALGEFRPLCWQHVLSGLCSIYGVGYVIPYPVSWYDGRATPKTDEDPDDDDTSGGNGDGGIRPLPRPTGPPPGGGPAVTDEALQRLIEAERVSA